MKKGKYKHIKMEIVNCNGKEGDINIKTEIGNGKQKRGKYKKVEIGNVK